MDEEFDSLAERKRDIVMNSLLLKIPNGEPAYESTIAEIAKKEIMLGTEAGFYIMENPELISILPQMVEDVIRKNLNIEEPSKKPLKICAFKDMTPFSTSKELTEICKEMNEYEIKDLPDQIYSLIKGSEWRTHNEIRPKINDLIMGQYFKEFHISPFCLNESLDNPDNQKFTYTQDSGTKITVYDGEDVFCEISRLFIADSLPVIAEALIGTQGQLEEMIRYSYFKKKQEAVDYLCGQIPAFMLFVPNDIKHEKYSVSSREIKQKLETYENLNGQLVHTCIPYDEIKRNLKSEQERRMYHPTKA